MNTIEVRLSEQDVARIAEATAKKLLELRASQPEYQLPSHLTVCEAAKVLRRSTRWVRHLISIGRIPTTRIGDGPRPRLLVPRHEIAKLLAESTV